MVHLWALLLLFRVVVAVFMQTQHVPDEYWQSVEVAYNQVYGLGKLTWEWDAHLRSSLHAQIFSFLFAGLNFFGVDSALLVWLVPRVVQGVMCFLIDIGTYKLALEYFNWSKLRTGIAVRVLVLLISNWFHAYIGCRTLINSFEALLTVWGLYLYYRQKSSWDYFLLLVVVGLSTASRITTVVLWLPLIPLLAFRSVKNVSITLLAVGLSVVVLLVTDRIFYGEWVFTPWVFVQFNFLQGHSGLFGTHPFHWYFSQAMFVMLGLSYFLLLLYPKYSVKGVKDSLWALCMYFVLAFSFIGHKEFRFLYPILPPATVLAAYTLSIIPQRRRSLAMMGILVTNIVAGVIFCGIHQRGNLKALEFIRTSEHCGGGDTTSLHVWMGCHQTPGYSYVHGCVQEMEFFECPVSIDETTGKRRDTLHHMFGDHPKELVEWIYSGATPEDKAIEHRFERSSVQKHSRALPTYVLVYGDFAERIIGFLNQHNYVVVGQWYHTFLPMEESTSNYVVLFRKR
eukprot:PhF_6_TR5178/c1_g1_i1/m.7439/K05286/PIGB; phosphatidylinositol glycan, class B